MPAYRGQIAVREAGEAAYSYYECVKAHDDCPVCNKFVGNKPGGGRRRTRCYPELRMSLGPWWRFWRREYCPLGGVHDHYRCWTCLAQWVCFHIDMQPSAKVHVDV